MRRHKTMQAIGAVIHAAAITADEYRWSNKTFPVIQPAAKLALRRIETCGDAYLQRVSRGTHVEADASAEFDPEINAGVARRILEREPRNHLRCLGVGRGSSLEPVTLADWFAMRPGIRRAARAFFHPPVLERVSSRRNQGYREAGLQGKVDDLTAPIHDFEMMLDRSGAGLRLPD